MSAYNTKTRHSSHYYHSVIFALIEGLKKHLRQEDIAKRLNDASIPSPLGTSWTASKIKEQIKRLRNPILYRSPLYTGVLELVVLGDLSHEDAALLLSAPKVL
ncbi:MAG: hypothetical protein PGN26_11465 [Xylophilus ampelinus]